MFMLAIRKNDNSATIYLEGEITCENALELKSRILSLTQETDRLTIDATLLTHGDLSFFEIMISTFRDMTRDKKEFTFVSNEALSLDASPIFGDFQIVCRLLNMKPVRIKEIAYS
jgi:anti-anti-sigma regulatory factor